MVKQNKVISMRLPDSSGRRLRSMASRHGWTVSDTSARLVEEGLRRAEFAFIDFRDSPAGRQAYIQGSTMAVWEVVMIAGHYAKEALPTAEHLQWPEEKVRAALNYASAFPKEIQAAIDENSKQDVTALAQMLPNIQVFKSKSK